MFMGALQILGTECTGLGVDTRAIDVPFNAPYTACQIRTGDARSLPDEDRGNAC